MVKTALLLNPMRLLLYQYMAQEGTAARSSTPLPPS